MFKYKSIDKKQVEDRINRLKDPGSEKKKNLFKVTQTAQVVRIIPYIHNQHGCAFIERTLHYNMAGGTVFCPSTWGEECPICSFASDLWKKGQKDMAKKFFKKERIFVPVISRENGEQQPMFMGISDSTYQDILSTIADPDYGDVIHPLEGRDLTVVKIPQGQYGKISIKFKPKTTSIADSEKKMTEILESCPNFDTVYAKKSYEELEDVLKKTVASTPKETTETSDVPPSSAGSPDYLKQIDKALGN